MRERATTDNVIGILPGDDPRLRNEAIVIGAHYDHLGHGGEGSLAPDVDRPDPSRRRRQRLRHRPACWSSPAASPPGPPAAHVVFVTFSGEELGLLGSAHYVDAPARFRSTTPCSW